MTQRRERAASGEELCPLPAAGHTSAPTGQADPWKTPIPAGPAPTHRRSHKATGISGAPSSLQSILCGPVPTLPSTAIYGGGGLCCSQVRTLGFSHASSRASQEMHSRDGQADAESGTRANSFRQTQMKGHRASSPSTQGSSGRLLQGRMEDAVPKGRAVALNAPQVACVTAAKPSPRRLRQTPATPPSHLASV